MDQRVIDLAGQVFGRLTVLSFSDHGNEPGRAHWLCRCECGVEKAVSGKSLRRGLSLSCGCRKSEVTAARNATQGGLAKANWSVYSVWAKMLERCDDGHPRYSGRGITVCERWRTFANFLVDMGPRPPRLTLERIDNDGNYEPGNCRWATRKEQMRNTSVNRYIEIDGRKMVITAWAAEMRVTTGMISHRINKLGWSEVRAVLEPPRRRVSRVVTQTARP